jgi:hypothetical protein
MGTTCVSRRYDRRMDANQNRKITIAGREWPVSQPTAGQVMALTMIASGGISEGSSIVLTTKLIIHLIKDEEARKDFISEFITGGYDHRHLEAVARELVKTVNSEEEPEPQKTPAKRTAKRAAAKTASGKRAQ